MTRTRLPDRRPSAWFSTHWQSHEFDVTVGLHPESGAPLEVFANAKGNAKRGALDPMIADAAVLISVALQHGATVGELRATLLLEMTFDGLEVPASPIGAILKAVEDGLAVLDVGEAQ